MSSPEAATRLLRELRPVPRRYRPGETIVDQGQQLSCLYMVDSGTVRLCTVTEDGREAVVGLLGPGAMFGESALLDCRSSPVSARAVEDCVVLAKPTDQLLVGLAGDPSFELGLVHAMATRLARTTRALRNALVYDVPTRLSLVLWELAREHGERMAGGSVIRFEMTQQDIARMVGASRETVNKALAPLTTSGLIRVSRRRYVIADPVGLLLAAGNAGERVT